MGEMVKDMGSEVSAMMAIDVHAHFLLTSIGMPFSSAKPCRSYGAWCAALVRGGAESRRWAWA